MHAGAGEEDKDALIACLLAVAGKNCKPYYCTANPKEGLTGPPIKRKREKASATTHSTPIHFWRLAATATSRRRPQQYKAPR